MLPVSENHPLRRLFASLVENAFCAEIGLCDPLLTDYLADMLVNFTHIDELNMLSDARGKRLEELAAMLSVALATDTRNKTDRDRLTYRHIGDYSLFWAGVYPEHLTYARRDSPDALLDYVAQGKRSYGIAADLTGEDSLPPATLLRHLSEDFECCVHGLELVRKSWEEVGPSETGDLLH